ncbi:Oidioi.mRNA.OKI2018_I69.YSR.g17049.t1.cds [Oikopleura dioica]|uniref:Oidioi.mRNA.OKI2018_I69.YSR.g17049.t1.cds n=1 Tax=Oikopleura dioica TaxID=34765 RepID=A0ABN7SQB4_OIKDI|nr:Oidioi.mRNA.OKI2018_I69.YSR.g17049.t1.cds [Oikopleura dioica]
MKFLRAPLIIKPSNTKVRFTGFSREYLETILENSEEWEKIAKKHSRNTSGFYSAIIPYLEDIITNQPEVVFDNCLKGIKLAKKKNQVRRDLEHWFRIENEFFSKEDCVTFAAKDLGTRSTGLSQILKTTEINEDNNDKMNEAFIEDSGELEEEWMPESEEIIQEDEVVDKIQEANDEPERVKDKSPIIDIFLRSGKLPSNGKGGDNRTWSPKFINLSLEMLIKGETARSIHNFFKTTAKYYPELLGEEKRVPSPDWFERLRDSLKYLNEEHTKDVILKGKRFHLASDGAAMLDASKTISVGLIDESGKLHLIGTERSIGGTSQIIADQMIAIINKTSLGRVIGEKIDLLMSDQQSAQINANAIVAEKLTREINKEAPPSLFCAMHCVSNCDKNSCSALKEVNEEAFTLLELVKSVFGKPEKFGQALR